MEDDKASQECAKIKLLVKTARNQQDMTVDDDISIKDLRSKAAEQFEIGDPELAVLIFGGKILKDHENLKTHSIQDGQTIHLVIRTKPPEDNSRQHNTTNTNNQRNNNTIPITGTLGDIQQRLQQMMISNPESMQRMLDPMMQQLSNNPELLRSVFGAGQMQQLMEQNPELNHLLSSPEALRDSLEMVRNPAALQEVMRNYDRALNNMESIPGGYNVLRRMYTELQEPLIDAMQEQMGANQFVSATAASADARAGSDATTNQQNEPQRTENRDPLPNPWAAPQQPSRPNIGGTPGGGALPNVSDATMRSLIDASMNSFSQNPELLSRIADMSGSAGQAGAINPDMQSNALQMSSMFSNPEFVSLMTNPEAIQTLMQVQQGLERLQRMAPSLFPGMNLANPLLSNPQSAHANSESAVGGNQQSQQNLSSLFNQMLCQTEGTQEASARAVQTPIGQATQLNSLMQMLGNAGSNTASNNNSTPPEERYRSQLEQLNEMGFTNREENLRALIATFGDIHLAIARLL